MDKAHSGSVEELFEEFTQFLELNGLIMHEGKMVDASFTVAPRKKKHPQREQNDQTETRGQLW